MTCEICKKQPTGRNQKPLPCMKPDPSRPPRTSRYRGRGTDDSFYICSECGHEWMLEEGKDGFGWVP